MPRSNKRGGPVTKTGGTSPQVPGKPRRPSGAYRTDLAYIHDAGFEGLATSAAGELIRLLRAHGVVRGLVIDLGCGSGIGAARLRAAGYEVLGIDISQSMIALARQRVPDAQFRVGSYLEAELPACVAVAAVGECFSYLFDRRHTPQRLAGLFRRVHQALKPGGLFVFDVVARGRVPGRGPHRSYREGADWAVLAEAEEDRGAKLLTRRITSSRKIGRLYRRDHEVHRLRIFERPAVAAQLRSAGLRVQSLRGYGKLLFPPGLIGFLAQKL